MAELRDHVILITGATRGIGQATAEICAREGAIVVLSSIEAERADLLARTLPGSPERHIGLLLDVQNPEHREQAFDLIYQRYGRLNGLVNNAGIYFSKAFHETEPDEWNHVIEMDLNSVYDLSRRAITLFMEGGGGAIVNVTSVHAQATYHGSSAYAAAKGAVTALTRSLAVEYSAKNIRVNAVAPGLIKTEIWKSIVEDFADEAEALAYWKKNIPLGDIILPDAIGEIISFLLSDRARAMSGSIVFADGGMTSQLIADQ